MNHYNAARWICLFAILTMAVSVLIVAISTASADSAVVIKAKTDGNGHFSFEGNGARMNADIEIDGFDEANVNLTNAWGYSARIIYRNVGSGDILLSATHDFPYDPMYYYRWKTVDFKGDGEYIPPGGGGRLASLTNSPNVTGTIEYPEVDHKAQFLRDTRHSHADVTVLVHNGHNLENAIVTMFFTDPKVRWTDEDGRADFQLSAGLYHMTVEAEGFDAMIVDDLQFKAENRYLLQINMTNCTSSMGKPVCGPSAEDLILYYKEKGPACETISPQGYVNYFAERLRTCRARDDPEADGTLERMATKWGILPDPPLNVLLYSCNFTKIGCLTETTDCQWNVTFTVKNYQKYPCNYTVSMIVGNTTVPLKTGDLGPTWSSTKMETVNTIFTVEDAHDGDTMYLAVVSDKMDD